MANLISDIEVAVIGQQELLNDLDDTTAIIG